LSQAARRAGKRSASRLEHYSLSRRRSSRVTVKKKMPPGIKVQIDLAAKITIALAEGGMRFTFPPYDELCTQTDSQAGACEPEANIVILSEAKNLAFKS